MFLVHSGVCSAGVEHYAPRHYALPHVQAAVSLFCRVVVVHVVVVTADAREVLLVFWTNQSQPSVCELTNKIGDLYNQSKLSF